LAPCARLSWQFSVSFQTRVNFVKSSYSYYIIIGPIIPNKIEQQTWASSCTACRKVWNKTSSAPSAAMSCRGSDCHQKLLQ